MAARFLFVAPEIEAHALERWCVSFVFSFAKAIAFVAAGFTPAIFLLNLVSSRPGHTTNQIQQNKTNSKVPACGGLAPVKGAATKPDGCSGLQHRPACGNKLLQRHLARTITDGAQSLPK
jgi:hypothetical protein